MNWHVDFSLDAVKFLRHNHLEDDEVMELIAYTLRKFRGEDINVNVKKLGGKWEGFYRIRSGKLRIIVEFQFERLRVYVEKVDWRGSVYK